MRQAITQLSFDTRGKGMQDITRDLEHWLREARIGHGLLTVHCQHTSASLLISENASPAVQRDLLAWLDRAVPEGSDYEHDDEGPDDMPAHIKAVLTGVTLTIPVAGGRLMLGTWQGVFLVEHRARPHRRTLALHLVGE